MDFTARQLGNVISPTWSSKWIRIILLCKTLAPSEAPKLLLFLAKPFDEHTSDNRKCKTVVTLDGKKLTQTQKWDGKQTTLVREVKDGKLILTLTFNDVVSVRTYEREA
ncbi:fatty acid-binding protein, brain-like [Hypanus sabinus]|uniref:fatty acid-binding protein, brain-like n=1 Tax=Hypanus sabinus TaxID=79690 RepID=UPI0028C3E61B|nr:fatty acid-binding protein, brain-like [Hypanus sabinus]